MSFGQHEMTLPPERKSSLPLDSLPLFVRLKFHAFRECGARSIHLQTVKLRTELISRNLMLCPLLSPSSF